MLSLFGSTTLNFVTENELPDNIDRPQGRQAGRPGLRWSICALLFFATTINYVDRQVLSVLKPTLQHDLGWNEIDYSNIIFWFQVAYACGYLFAGRLMDLVGLRLGYTLAILFWSVAAMGHGLARTVRQFAAMRFGLGLAEGSNFPAAVKAVSEWFPKKERAFATGLFNAGTNVGAILTPLVVPWIVVKLGWPWAFGLTGALGMLGGLAWLIIYRRPERHPWLSRAEMVLIRSDPPDPIAAIPWARLLEYPTTWAFVIGMAMTSPIWWFYLYWVPGFLFDRYHVDLIHIGPPLVTIYIISDLGSILGGWMSSRLIQRGWDVLPARKLTMLVCALCVIPVFFAGRTSGVWPATLLIALAAAAHQGWAANLYTLVSDSMPTQSVGSVIGIGGFAGAVAGMFFAKVIGYLLQWTHSYLVIFAIAPAAYLGAILMMHLVLRKRKV
jgi:ACS family hexuronate transporter-like MFS transporter